MKNGQRIISKPDVVRPTLLRRRTLTFILIENVKFIITTLTNNSHNTHLGMVGKPSVDKTAHHAAYSND